MGRRAGKEEVTKPSYALLLLQCIRFIGRVRVRTAKEGDQENRKDHQNHH